MDEASIEVSGLRKRFGPTQALDGMTFSVAAGTGHRVRRSERGRQVHHDAGHPGLDAPDEGHALVGGRPYATCATRCGRSARWWTRPRCSPAAPGAITCGGWPARSGCRRPGSTR